MRTGLYFKGEKPFFILAPILLWQVLFFYLPLGLIATLSIIKFSSFGISQGFTWENYIHFFTPTYFFILIKSLLLALSNGILCFIIGYPLAYFISFKSKGSKNLFLFLLILPFWTNFLLHIYAWFFVLDRGGVVNALLLRAGIINEPLHMLNSLTAIMLLMVYSYLPFMVLSIYSVLERFDRRLLEASADLGATSWQTAIRITLPLSSAGVISGFALVFVPSFSEFVIPALMGGEKHIFAGSVIAQYILSSRTSSLGAAFTVISSCILVLFIVVLYKLARKAFKELS